MNSQARAIVWAQLRMFRNYLPRSPRAGLLFGAFVSFLWYGMWIAFAYFISRVLAEGGSQSPSLLSGGLLICFIYWQVIPVVLAATGASLEIKKLIVYPIPHAQLFYLEALLRVTASTEVAILLVGIAVGLSRGPQYPRWAALPLILFVIFNLCLAAGLREILARLFARKRVREVAIFLLVLCGAVPQFLAMRAGALHSSRRMPTLFQGYDAAWWPWSAVATLAHNIAPWRSLAVLVGWTTLAYAFGRWQFERGLSFDAGAAGATVQKPESTRRSLGWGQAFFRWPSKIFPDPLAALVEKEIRFLSRAPRFRLVFTMGFTFGLIIWLPIAYRGESGGGGFMSRNYLTLVSVYALLLLGDVCFWNVFGFDRRAAQIYFAAPLRFATVLLAKNISALFFVLLEITAITLVCATLRMPVTAVRLTEAYAVTLVIGTYLISLGNITSVRNARAVNPDKSTRSSGGSMQALLVLVYPVASLPVMLAYLARYAFDSQAAFFGVLAIAAGIGGIVYWVAMDSSLQAVDRLRERMLDKLSQGDGLIQG